MTYGRRHPLSIARPGDPEHQDVGHLSQPREIAVAEMEAGATDRATCECCSARCRRSGARCLFRRGAHILPSSPSTSPTSSTRSSCRPRRGGRRCASRRRWRGPAGRGGWCPMATRTSGRCCWRCPAGAGRGLAAPDAHALPGGPEPATVGMGLKPALVAVLAPLQGAGPVPHRRVRGRVRRRGFPGCGRCGTRGGPGRRRGPGPDAAGPGRHERAVRDGEGDERPVRPAQAAQAQARARPRPDRSASACPASSAPEEPPGAARRPRRRHRRRPGRRRAPRRRRPLRARRPGAPRLLPRRRGARRGRAPARRRPPADRGRVRRRRRRRGRRGGAARNNTHTAAGSPRPPRGALRCWVPRRPGRRAW